jgi:large conductance mechanosensitive channel
MLKDFKEFAIRGNVIDLAIGVMIGAAMGALVTSAVNDLLTPLISGLVGTPDFSNLFVVLRNETGKVFTSVEEARKAGAVVFAYGIFFNAVISFLIVTFVLFLIVRAVNKMRSRFNKEEPAVAEAPRQEVLLEEIRDLLRNR